MNNGKYFFIPDWLLQENSQTIHAYIYIINEINNCGGEFITTKKEIAKSLGLTERQVRTVLTKMSDRSQTEVRPMSNRNTSLSINFKSVLDNFENANVRPKSDRSQTEVRPKEIKTQTNSFNFRTSLIDYGFETSLVDDWLKVRKTKKATNTQTAFKSFIAEIESRQCNINEMLQTSVTNSWSGFKHKWVDNLSKTTQQEKPQEQKIGRTSIETIKKNAEYNGEY